MFLADYVLIQSRVNLLRNRQLGFARGLGALGYLLPNNVIAEFDALVANKNRWTGNEFAYFVLTLTAERAIQQFAGIVALTALIVRHTILR